ncbi:MAG: hypothetical protein PVJ39_03670 [Gammaproteobacteria bacterium]
MDLIQKNFYALVLFISSFPVSAATFLDLGAGLASGDFDTGVDTTSSHLTAKYGYFGTRYFFNAAIPYLNVDTDGLDQQSGLGDTVLEAGYIYRGNDNDFKLFPSVSIKLPTANEDDGLGTGESDLGIFLDGQKSCGPIVCTAGVGYIFIGDPAGIDFNNILQLNAGVYKPFRKSGLSAYLQYDSAMVDGRSDPVKFGAEWFYLMSLDTTFYVNGLVGLTDVAPDYGFHTGIVTWFW